MLIRFATSNFLSFEAAGEFNMLPAPKYRRLDSHKYNIQGFDVLKMAAIYGANGAGKSNLIKSLYLLKHIVLHEKLLPRINKTKFKLNGSTEDTPQMFAVEFFQSGTSYYYALEIVRDYIKTEELYVSGLGKTEDRLIFERNTDEQGACKIKFSAAFERDAESMVLARVIEKNLAKPDMPLLKLLTTLNNPFLGEATPALQWFDRTLEIIATDSRPHQLPFELSTNEGLKNYVKEIMRSFDVGINGIVTHKKKLKEYLGEDDEQKLGDIIRGVEGSPQKRYGFQNHYGEEMVAVKEKEEYFVLQLKLEHSGKNNKSAAFSPNEESEGTLRLLEFTPAFWSMVTQQKVFVIDEIERSVHPLLIKELLKKFSLDDNTKGQLIFSTHESNLLDQEIFRQDEIWFVKKNKEGASELYSLSDFKEHNTIDIRKGYLNGRYGSVPFLGNLHDLNWHKHDS